MLLKISLLFACTWLVYSEPTFSRSKRDTKTLVNDLVHLYYYGQNFTMKTITLNTNASKTCNAKQNCYAFYLHDIIGQAENVATVKDCLAGCMNIPSCVAVNYISDAKQCIALASGTPNRTELFVDNDLGGSCHHMFEECPSKPPKQASKLPGGSAPNGCGLPFFQPNIFTASKSRIIGGTEAVPYSYPWMARLVFYSSSGVVTCGAALIMTESKTESDLLITAAHCVSDSSLQQLNKYRVIVGNHNNKLPESQEQSVIVKNLIRYKDNGNSSTFGDITMIKLATPVKFNNYVRPICLPKLNQQPKDANSCVATGWGRISDENQQTAVKLQQLKMPLLDDKICQAKWGGTFKNATMTCAGNQDGQTSTCQGDSGGPLNCFEDGHWTLYGAVSFGATKCAHKDYPTVFARVSGLRDWIDKTSEQLKKA